jgi:2'-5' RNA ligase
MHGLVSLLPQPYYEMVEQIWGDLEKRFSLSGIRVTPLPHFSWNIAEDYPPEKLEPAMREVASQLPPLRVHTGGLGIFTGPSPVIFLPVVKTPSLTRAHQIIWDRFQSVATDLSPYYSPENWIPHISLAYQDVTSANIGVVIEYLASQVSTWEMTVDNITFIYEPTGAVGSLNFCFPLTGN